MKIDWTHSSGLLAGMGTRFGSGCTAKVLAFPALGGRWDPSQAFMMAAAILVAAIGLRFAGGRPPLVFVGAMLAGMVVFEVVERLAALRAERRHPSLLQEACATRASRCSRASYTEQTPGAAR